MRIGILTIHNSPNYGACLQCFALWKFLVDNGYEAEVIDLHRPLAFEDYVPSNKYKRMRPVKEGQVDILKKSIKRLFGLKEKKFVSLYNKEAQILFDSFNSQIKYSKPYKGIDELYSNPPVYDALIAGSDQLWNPTQAYCLEPFFLTFVNNYKCKKLSYATSIGISDLYESEKKLFAKWLVDFNAISVREKQAKKMLSSFVNKEIAQVADPTFLLAIEFWNSIAVRPKECGYILLFDLTPIPEMVEYAVQISKQAAKKLIVVGQKEPISSDNSYEVINNAGPQEWMGYIANADLVLTNSFHCTVFSLLLGAKNFYTYIAPANKRGSRITDLLLLFELENHLLNPTLCQSYNELKSNIIDREFVLKIHNTEQVRSREYLLKNLNNEHI